MGIVLVTLVDVEEDSMLAYVVAIVVASVAYFFTSSDYCSG